VALLDIRGLRHCFGGLVALDNVSVQVSEGQIKAVIGPNGAGKTTLFNIISGILQPERGSVLFDGLSLHGTKPYQVARRGISRTFQNVSLFRHMTVLENVMVGRHGRSRCGMLASALRMPAQRREEKAVRESAMTCLDFCGLAHAADVEVAALSFGQRRMVELARALATEPRLVLLDEPASGLNTKETDDLATLVTRIRDSGVTVLLVEHDMSLVMDISDEILVLDFGVPIAEGVPSDIRSDPQVIAVYLGGEFSNASG
jgi:branched-chain amino acid transport system ATP-binding protein